MIIDRNEYLNLNLIGLIGIENVINYVRTLHFRFDRGHIILVRSLAYYDVNSFFYYVYSI